MKKAEDLKKSEHGRISNKRKFNEELDLALAESYRKINFILTQGSNRKSSPTDALNNIHNSKSNIFNVGDMVWAKLGKYSAWPGIIISDPETNEFSKNENMVPLLHIYYCNEACKRNWIEMKLISKFSGKEEILTKIPKITTHISRSKLKIKWNQAVKEAECLAAMNKDERILSFFANNFLPSNSQLINKAESSTEKKTFIKQPDMLEKNYNDHQQVEFNLKEQALANNDSKDHPYYLIPELCRQFYANGLITGTFGGISIKYNDYIFIVPSGVQKERIEPDDLFVQNLNGEDIIVPKAEKKLSKSQCTPIFMCLYDVCNAGAVIHIHSQEVVKLCLLNPENELRITGLEMIKGIFNEKRGKFYDKDEELIIPIIENSKYEKDLIYTFKMVLRKYPSTSAVLVRNHGMYTWGKDWKAAKTQLECYEYLFKITTFKKIHNV